MQPLRRAIFAAFSLTLAAAGCSSSDDGTLPPSEPTETTPTTVDSDTTTSTTAPTTTAPAEETTTTAPAEVDRPKLDPANWETDVDEIFGRYLLYWRELDVAFGPPAADPDHEPLADLLGPEALVDAKTNISAYQDAGEVIVRPEGSLDEHVLRLPAPTSLEKVEGNEVIIQDCHLEDLVVEDLDGEFVDTLNFPTVYNATMKVIDGEWRVFANVVAADGSDGWEECNKAFADLGQ